VHVFQRTFKVLRPVLYCILSQSLDGAIMITEYLQRHFQDRIFHTSCGHLIKGVSMLSDVFRDRSMAKTYYRCLRDRLEVVVGVQYFSNLISVDGDVFQSSG
jgi:hypothetical protein